MRILVHEIRRTQNWAEKKKMGFAVRLNGTSDLSPESFVLNGKNILEIFPTTQFYDYTKVYSRISLLQRYDNYDLTFSYNGHNYAAAQKFLEAGGKVAVVFANQKKLPKYFGGFPVCDGNAYDMRFIDPGGHVIGLHYHTTAANYDAIIMGKNVLKHFFDVGCHGIYVTHLKELCDVDDRIVGLSAQLDENGKQNFKILKK